MGEIIGLGHSSKKLGIAILFNKKIKFTINKTYFDPAGRYMFVNCFIDGNNITFVNVYAPNDDIPSFFGEIEIKLADFIDCNIVIGGF